MRQLGLLVCEEKAQVGVASAQPGISWLINADESRRRERLPTGWREHDEEDSRHPGEKDAALPFARHFLTEAEQLVYQPLDGVLQASRESASFAGREKAKKMDKMETAHSRWPSSKVLVNGNGTNVEQRLRWHRDVWQVPEHEGLLRDLPAALSEWLQPSCALRTSHLFEAWRSSDTHRRHQRPGQAAAR